MASTSFRSVPARHPSRIAAHMGVATTWAATLPQWSVDIADGAVVAGASEYVTNTHPAVSPVGSAVGPGSSGARRKASVTAEPRPFPYAPGAVFPSGVGGYTCRDCDRSTSRHCPAHPWWGLWPR